MFNLHGLSFDAMWRAFYLHEMCFSPFRDVKLFLKTDESLQSNSLNVRGDLSHQDG